MSRSRPDTREIERDQEAVTRGLLASRRSWRKPSRPATMARLMPDFSPVITYSSPCARARQARLAGRTDRRSVSAIDTMVSPRTVGGSQQRLISSVPFLP